MSMIPTTNIQLQVLTKQYAIWIKVITFMDIRAHKTMMNPGIILKQFWVPQMNGLKLQMIMNSNEWFKAIDDKLFATGLIRKHPIGIKFILKCVIQTRVLGTWFLEKDILIVMDVYSRSFPKGFKFHNYFKAFVQMPKLYLLSQKAPPNYKEL